MSQLTLLERTRDLAFTPSTRFNVQPRMTQVRIGTYNGIHVCLAESEPFARSNQSKQVGFSSLDRINFIPWRRTHSPWSRTSLSSKLVEIPELLM